MRVEKISIRNIMGVEALDIQPGAVTTITGANGTGKSSILEAIKAVLGKGTDATLVRKGQSAGEVVFVLEDGRSVREYIPAEGGRARPIVKDASGKALPKPQSIIEDLFDSVSANPVSFLMAPPKHRAEWLLEAMPISVPAAEIKKAVSEKYSGGDLNLDGLAALRQKVYDDRTGLNRVAKESAAAATALSAQMPDGDADEIEKAAREAGEKLAQVENQLGQSDGTLRAQLAEMESSLRQELADAEKGLREKYDEQIRDLERQVADLRRQWADERTELMRINRDVLTAETNEIRNQHADDTLALSNEKSRIKAELSRLGEMGIAHVKAKQTRQLIEEQQAAAAEAQARADKATAALENLDALKESLLSKLPIPGAEVRDGDIWVGGIQFDRLNTAKRVQIALKVAKLRAGKVPLVVVDNLECLDSETFHAFEQAAAKSGMQFVITRVSDGPLEVTTI